MSNGFFEKSLRISTFCVCPTRNQILSGIRSSCIFCYSRSQTMQAAYLNYRVTQVCYKPCVIVLSLKIFWLLLDTWYPLILIIGYQIALCEQFLSNDQRFQVLRTFYCSLSCNKILMLKCYNLHFWKYFKWQCIQNLSFHLSLLMDNLILKWMYHVVKCNSQNATILNEGLENRFISI